MHRGATLHCTREAHFLVRCQRPRSLLRQVLSVNTGRIETQEAKAVIQGCQGEIDGSEFGVANALQVCFVVADGAIPGW